MVNYRLVPAKIATVDHVGISTAQSELLLKRAENATIIGSRLEEIKWVIQ